MAENITTRLGERGNGKKFKATCPRGGHITGFYGDTDTFTDNKTFITSIGAKCSDGSDLGKYGSSGTIAPDKWVLNQDKPFYNFNGATMMMGSASSISKFMGNGTMEGSAWSSSCPSGVAVGVYGTDGEGSRINSYGIECGVPVAYCMSHLDDPACANIDEDNLNKACALKFTSLCKEKQDMLTPETLKAYCKTNPNDTICPKSASMYTPSFAATDPTGTYTRPPMPGDSTSNIVSTNNILIMIVVVVFGGVIAFMLLKDKPVKSTISQQPQAQQPYYQQPQAQQPYYQPTQQPY